MRLHPWVNPAVDTINVRVVYKHVFIIASIMVLGASKALWQVAQSKYKSVPVVRNPGVEAKSGERAESENGWAD